MEFEKRKRNYCTVLQGVRCAVAFLVAFYFSRVLHLWHSVESPLSFDPTIQPLSHLPPKKTIRKDTIERKIVFVHVGKAAGETIKNILKTGCLARTAKRRQQKCLAGLPESRLSDLVIAYFHCFDVPRLRKLRPTSFLFNLRHPVDRALSWYGYIHPEHCKNLGSPACRAKSQHENEDTWIHRFFDCFPTAEEWTLPRTENCSEIARQAWEGSLDYREVPLAAHMIANYQHYINNTLRILPNREILVVRTAELWPDLKALDEWLGGTGRFGRGIEGTAVTHGSHRYANPVLNSTSMLAACCALLPELNVYLDLLDKAANLDHVTKDLERKEAVKRCGPKSWEELLESCSGMTWSQIKP